MKIYAVYEKNKTIVPYTFYGHDSILLELIPGMLSDGINMEKAAAPFRLGRKAFEAADAPAVCWDSVPYTLSETNVLVLDQMEYALDDGDYVSREEVLRVDNILRKQLGYPLREDAYAQPWTVENSVCEHTVRLKYLIPSDIEEDCVELALEHVKDTEIRWNGEFVSKVVSGYYVDKSIRKVGLGRLKAGLNVLELKIPFGRSRGLEACYLLGGFGVRVCGRRAELYRLPETLSLGDITSCGLPFYGCNIDYHFTVTGNGRDIFVRASQYRGALIDVLLDGVLCGQIAFAPYQAVLKQVSSGEQVITLKLYGNRVNTFGALHNCNERFWWHGPDAYRVNRDEWTYGYCLKATGILKSPEIFDDACYRK